MRENRNTESFVRLAMDKLGLEYCDMTNCIMAERGQHFFLGVGAIFSLQ